MNRFFCLMVAGCLFLWVPVSFPEESSRCLVKAGTATNEAGLELPSIFSDHMILQRGKEIRVWGRATPGEKVIIKFARQCVSAVSVNGEWEAVLSAVPAGGPYDLTVICRDVVLTCANVMVGEVWICAGQSNMMYPLKLTEKAKRDIPSADYPLVRYFYQDTVRDSTPRFDVKNGRWVAISPETVADFGAVPFYFGTKLHDAMNVPIGLINVAVGATAIQAHMSAQTLEAVASLSKGSYEYDSAVYYSMIKPVQPYVHSGVLWYQGEANSARNELFEYKGMLSELIDAWRADWRDPVLPFILVQLPGFHENTIYKWPVLREGYVDLISEKENVGMVVSIDTGLEDNIHPPQKEIIGSRLVDTALEMVYGDGSPCKSPLFKEMLIRGDRVVLSFDNAENGFLIKGDGEILGFEICGEDQWFFPAVGRVSGGNQIEVWSDDVAKPVAVRHAWEQLPKVNVYNKEGFPLCPFRTDRFDPNTKKNSHK